MARLSPDTLLSIRLDAICSRNRYTTDPGPVLDELCAVAGDRVDVLTESVGTWVGFFGQDEHVQTLVAALRQLPGLKPWIALGAHRRSLPHHRTPDARRGGLWPEQSGSDGVMLGS